MSELAGTPAPGPARTIDEIVQANEPGRIDELRGAVTLLALISPAALRFTRGIPKTQPGAADGKA